MKIGDKVTCILYPGVFELVWYKKGDATCGIQNDNYRYVVKVKSLSLVKK